MRQIPSPRSANFYIFNVISDNVKALYRRAKAHVGAWNPDSAKADYNRCLELDSSLKATITRELDELNEQVKLIAVTDKLKYQKLFAQSGGGQPFLALQ